MRALVHTSPVRDAMRRLGRAAMRFRGYRLAEAPTPPPATAKLARTRLGRLRVRRLRRRAEIYEVRFPHWWFGWQCAARLELAPQDQRTRIAWRILRPGQARPSLAATLVVSGSTVSLVMLGLLAAPWSPFFGFLLFLSPIWLANPTILFGLTSGGPGRASRRRRLFALRVERAMRDTLRDAARLERQTGALALALPDETGQLGLTQFDSVDRDG